MIWVNIIVMYTSIPGRVAIPSFQSRAANGSSSSKLGFSFFTMGKSFESLEAWVLLSPILLFRCCWPLTTLLFPSEFGSSTFLIGLFFLLPAIGVPSLLGSTWSWVTAVICSFPLPPRSEISIWSVMHKIQSRKLWLFNTRHDKFRVSSDWV